MTPEDRPPPQWMISQLERQISGFQKELENAWRELRENIRRGDNQAQAIANLDERLREGRKMVDECHRFLQQMDISFRERFVSKDDFKPYRTGVIAIIVAITTGVLGAVLRLVLVQN